MKIKDENELAHILGMAFSQHANRVQNGAVEPYKSFMSGAESVDVTVTLSGNGTITVKLIAKETVVEPKTKEKQGEVRRINTSNEIHKGPDLPGVITL